MTLNRWLLAALGLVATVASAAPEYKWTMSFLPVTGTTYYDAAQVLPERIRKATNGRVEITANGSLVPGNRLLEAVRDGEVQMTMPLSGYYTASQPLFTLGALPGISESQEDLDRLLDSSYGQALREMYARDYKARELMNAAFCPQTMFSNKPVVTAEDWKGLRVRVNNAGTAVLANVLGAKPTSLAAGEVLPALQRGVIDAVLTDACWAYGAGFYTAVKHASVWKLGSVVPWNVLVNQDAWAKLPKDLQQSIENELVKMEAELKKDWQTKVDALPSQWQAKGVKYHVVSEAESKKVHDPKYMTPVFEAWYKQAEARGVDAKRWEKVAREAVAR